MLPPRQPFKSSSLSSAWIVIFFTNATAIQLSANLTKSLRITETTQNFSPVQIMLIASVLVPFLSLPCPLVPLYASVDLFSHYSLPGQHASDSQHHCQDCCPLIRHRGRGSTSPYLLRQLEGRGPHLHQHLWIPRLQAQGSSQAW